MKKTSILLIALSLFAMIFSGCSMLVPDKTTATIDDFQGTWVWSTENQNSTAKVKSMTFEIKANKVTVIDDSENTFTLNAYVDPNGILTASGTVFGTSYLFRMTVKQTKTMITVTSDSVYNLTGLQTIVMTKNIDLSNLPFEPDLSVTFADYKGSWYNKEKNVTFTFGTDSIAGREIQLVSVNGLSNEFTMPSFVIVAKGVATTTVNDVVYVMYMNKTHDGITVTGPKVKELTGVLCFNLDKN